MKYEDFAALAAKGSIAVDGLAGIENVTSYPFENKKKPGFARRHFRMVKRCSDIVLCIALLPVMVICALGLLIANPFANRGPLFFVQPRMGRNCEPFNAIKFRSMKPAKVIERRADCPVEADRITRLGHFIRKTRIDELPQIINVLRGEMSLIGPRPDYYDHACHFLENVPGYRERHLVLPGISGLAQTEVGYVQGTDATRRKVQADLHYINHSGFRLEAWIFMRTFAVVFGRKGV